MAFSGLDDPEAASKGALAGLYGAIFTGFFASLFGGTPSQVTGPTAPMTTVLASVVVSLAATNQFSTPEILTLTFFCVLLAGACQIAFGLLKLGQFIKYIPYPVVAGFMNGIAVLIFLSQVRPFVGLTNKNEWEAMLAPSSYQTGTILAGVVTILACVFGPKLLKSIPGALQGLFIGSAAYYGYSLLSPDSPMGATIGAIPSAIPMPDQLPNFLKMGSEMGRILPLVLPSAFALGVLGSIDSLLTSVVADTATRTRHDSRQELIGQGIGNMVSGAFGGLAGAGATVRTLVNIQAGGRGKISGMIHGVLLLLVVVAAGKIAGMIPMVVLAGILLVTAVKMVDTWSSSLVVKVVGTPEERRLIILNLMVVFTVTVITVLVDLMVAVAVGIVLSGFLFIYKMTKNPVYRLTSLHEHDSRRVLPTRLARALKESDAGTVVIELTGALFFGTADLLANQVENALEPTTKRVILDFRRVGEVDSTGARILTLLAEQLCDRNIRPALSSVAAKGLHRNFFTDMGVVGLVGEEFVFLDLDHALEWAENEAIKEIADWDALGGGTLKLSELELFKEISEDDIVPVAGFFELCPVKTGEVLFSPGEESDNLFVVASGSVSRLLDLKDKSSRLASYSPGTVVGEMEMFTKVPRKGYLVSDQDSEVYRLSGENLERMKTEHPAVASRFLHNVAHELSERLHQALDEVRILE